MSIKATQPTKEHMHNNCTPKSVAKSCIFFSLCTVLALTTLAAIPGGIGIAGHVLKNSFASRVTHAITLPGSIVMTIVGTLSGISLAGLTIFFLIRITCCSSKSQADSTDIDETHSATHVDANPHSMSKSNVQKLPSQKPPMFTQPLPIGANTKKPHSQVPKTKKQLKAEKREAAILQKPTAHDKAKKAFLGKLPTLNIDLLDIDGATDFFLHRLSPGEFTLFLVPGDKEALVCLACMDIRKRPPGATTDHPITFINVNAFGRHRLISNSQEDAAHYALLLEKQGYKHRKVTS